MRNPRLQQPAGQRCSSCRCSARPVSKPQEHSCSLAATDAGAEPGRAAPGLSLPHAPGSTRAPKPGELLALPRTRPSHCADASPAADSKFDLPRFWSPLLRKPAFVLKACSIFQASPASLKKEKLKGISHFFLNPLSCPKAPRLWSSPTTGARPLCVLAACTPQEQTRHPQHSPVPGNK